MLVALRKLVSAAAMCWREAWSWRRLALKPALWFEVAVDPVVEVEQSGQACMSLGLCPADVGELRLGKHLCEENDYDNYDSEEVEAPTRQSHGTATV
jgi:hypothetical protein